jgi:CHAT domain-containing protein/tetratricopeptide (TPR) repeat protein
MKYGSLILTLILVASSEAVHSQSYEFLEKEYLELTGNIKKDAALQKAKEIYFWVKNNESDTSIHLPISLKYIGNVSVNVDSALHYYEMALRVLDQQKRSNHIQCAYIHHNKSLSYHKWKYLSLPKLYYYESLKEAELALKIFEMNGIDFKNEFYYKVSNQLAILYSSQKIGKGPKAIAIYQEMIGARKAAFGKDSPKYASALERLAQYYCSGYFFPAGKDTDSSIGGYTKGVALLNEAAAIRRQGLKSNIKSCSITLNNLGNTYVRLGEFDNAKKCFMEIIAILERDSLKDTYTFPFPSYFSALRKLSNIYEKSENHNEAERAYYTQMNYAKKTYGIESSQYFDSKRDLSRFFIRYEKYQLAYHNLNDLYKSLLFDFSRTDDRFMLDVWRIQGLADDIYYLLTSVNGDIAEVNTLALNISLFVKSNSLQVMGMRNKMMLSSRRNKDMLDTLEGYRANKLGKKVDSLNRVINLLPENRKINLRDIQNRLSRQEVAIEFIRDRGHSGQYLLAGNLDSLFYYALLIGNTDSAPHLIKLCSEAKLNELSPKGDLDVIYNLVWEPIQRYLGNVNTIYYSSSGLLNNISFNSLMTDKNGKREFVMDRYTLHKLTSTGLLALGLKQNDNTLFRPHIVLFGGIDYDSIPTPNSKPPDYLSSNSSGDYERELDDSSRFGARFLRYAKEEVFFIDSLLTSRNWESNLRVGRDASERNLKYLIEQRFASVLHIATHGFAYSSSSPKIIDDDATSEEVLLGDDMFKRNPNSMIRCGLFFSGANLTWLGRGDSLYSITHEDGILTAYELSKLDLSQTKLAVLSACETGIGFVNPYEGTYGLLRALKLAGVDNMIVSLWKVPDDATMELMTLFYTEISKTRNPVTSFEHAQRTMRVNHPDKPEKWAGFVFIR